MTRRLKATVAGIAIGLAMLTGCGAAGGCDYDDDYAQGDAYSVVADDCEDDD